MDNISLLKEEIQKIFKLNTTDLIKSGHFKSYKEVFDSIFDLFSKLSEMINDTSGKGILLMSPDEIIAELVGLSKEFLKIFHYVIDLSSYNKQQRDLEKSIDKHFTQLYKAVTPVFMAYIFKGVNTVERSLSIAQERIIGERDTMQKIVKDAKEILEKVKIVSGEAGVCKHAGNFEKQACEHKTKRSIWLGVTSFMALLTISFGVLLFFGIFNQEESISTGQIVRITIAKIIVFSILYFGLILSSRIYKSHWHNYIVNIHRHHALNTFEAFIKACGDDKETRNAVILQTTLSIFSPQSTGFMYKDSESSYSPHLLEVMKSFISK